MKPAIKDTSRGVTLPMFRSLLNAADVSDVLTEIREGP
jgi:hypothetical protein